MLLWRSAGSGPLFIDRVRRFQLFTFEVLKNWNGGWNRWRDSSFSRFKRKKTGTTTGVLRENESLMEFNPTRPVEVSAED